MKRSFSRSGEHLEDFSIQQGVPRTVRMRESQLSRPKRSPPSSHETARTSADLLEKVRDGDPWVWASLKHLATPELVALMLSALEVASAHELENLAQALSMLDDVHGLDVLARRRREQSDIPSLAMTLATAELRLGTTDLEATKVIVDQMRSPATRRSAAIAAARVVWRCTRQSPAVDALARELQALVDEEDPALFLCSLPALSSERREQALVRCKEILESGDDKREWVASFLAQWPPGRGLLHDRFKIEPDVSRRLDLALLAPDVDPALLVAALTEGFASDSPSIRAKAFWLLPQLAPEAARSVCIHALKDEPDPSLRRALQAELVA